MQTQNPFLDEMAKLTNAAMGLAQSAGEEARAAFRAQADRMAAELDLIRREDFDALKAEVAALRAEVAELKAAQAPAKAPAKPAAKKSPKAGA
ncbi:MAG: hypothetical protein CFE28_05260 [Alphaproteobacteria bacterium PA2]|nr:MAG: hypothetical protein CFE28_05260 [Alphaproteobacteria bacterium PA2]